ncbi:SPOR domain-containing protein [uncultured Helicobacter sp.]|uniref:SPOR domain-containing protein n=1 Tax=uncultured Helicobacter sp. TaxID=175537 RepID=UPI00260944E9|nr:SPOR domain-containing protein [uncultured Helicobacter sp.]
MTELESDKHTTTTRDLELDDLLISNGENDELKGGNNKKLILLSAIGVLLFAVVILVVYLFQGDSEDEKKQNLEMQKSLERIESKSPQTSSGNQQNTDFGQVPIQNNTSSDDQFQMIINQIKAQQNQSNSASSQALPTAPSSTQKTESSKPSVQPIQSAQVPSKTQNKEPSKVGPKESFKDVKANDPTLQGSEAVRGFYVQVGSFSKFSPNKQLLGLINDNKFSYRMQKSGDNNRLLIGPYSTKQEAQSQLSEIRTKINKDAFIKEIK